MHAEKGDWLVVESRTVGHVVRRGRIVEAHGPGGAPPYVVRWTDNDHEVLVFPGPDAHVVTAEQQAAHDEAERRRVADVQAAILEQHPAH